MVVSAICPLQVVQQKTQEQEGYTAVQLGCGSKREKNVHFGYKLLTVLSERFGTVLAVMPVKIARCQLLCLTITACVPGL